MAQMATASSAYDLNLTAQLAVDGIIEQGEPRWLEVVSNEGPLPQHAREWTIDGGRYSEWPLMGEQAFIEYRWHGSKQSMDGVRITGRVAHSDDAKGPYVVKVMGSKDGKTWSTLATQQADTLPGRPLAWRLHSDPNKQTDNDLLPARNLDLQLTFAATTDVSFLRIEFSMSNAVYWMLWDVDILQKTIDGSLHSLQQINSNHQFYSAWMSNAGGEEWLEVTLPSPQQVDSVLLYWINAPLRGTLAYHAADEHKVDLNSKGGTCVQRFAVNDCISRLQLLLHEPDASGRYVLSEVVLKSATETLRPVVSTYSPIAMDGKLLLNGGDWLVQPKHSHPDATFTPIVTHLPATVLTAFMNDGRVPNVLVGNGLQQVSDSYFNQPFEYETTFCLPANWQREQTWLCFDGINYKIEVTLNGVQLPESVGAFRRHQYDVTEILRSEENHLCVTVYPPPHPGAAKMKTKETTGTNGGRLAQDSPTYLATVGWDWISTLPGRNMGIVDGVWLSTHEGLVLSDPYVETHLTEDTLATITPRVFVKNTSLRERTFKVRGELAGRHFETTAMLAPLSEKELVFLPDEISDFYRQAIALWWPNDMGSPTRHRLSFQIVENGQTVDTLSALIGLREVTYQDVDSQLKLFVNGRRVVPLGGNWGFSELNLNYAAEDYDTAVRYHRDQHFNMIRNWVGQTSDQAFFDACDRYGILVWQDFWLANPADGPNPTDESRFVATAEDFVRQIRRHPAIALYCGRNEGVPPVTLDDALRETVGRLTANCYISDSADGGVSGHGPYKAQSPKEYFRLQTGKLHTERGMPCMPTREGLHRLFGGEIPWPQDALWGQHDYTQRGAQGAATFNALVEEALGEVTNGEMFADHAQLINYNGYRAMYESTLIDRQGLLIWMSHPCWPTTVWQTYDYYMEPTAAYFGVKKACEPEHVFYHPLDSVVMVCNRTDHQGSYTVKARIVDMQGGTLWKTEQQATVAPDATQTLMKVLEPESLTGSYLLVLTLSDSKGNIVSDNRYLLSMLGENYQDARDNFQLAPKKKIKTHRKGDGTTVYTVTLRNPYSRPIVLHRLNLTDDAGQQLLPVIYEDNYITLLPKERKTLNVQE